MDSTNAAEEASSDILLQVLSEHRFADLVTVVSVPPGSDVAVGTKLLTEHGGSVWGSLGTQDLDRAALADAKRVMVERKSKVIAYPVAGGEIEAFHELLEPQPQLLILGAGHIAVPLAKFGREVGFEVVVLDDRDKFANEERFPGADEVIAGDFGETLANFRISPFTYVVIITRAHTYDEESLRVLLGHDAAYIGMIGSRRRVETVLKTLAAEGFDRDRLSKIYSPIGLDIGAETPEEIALAIMAEVVAARRGGTGQPMSRMLRPMAF